MNSWDTNFIPKKYFAWVPTKVRTSAYFSDNRWVWLQSIYRANTGSLYDNYWSAVEANRLLDALHTGKKIEITVYGGGGGGASKLVKEGE